MEPGYGLHARIAGVRPLLHVRALPSAEGYGGVPATPRLPKTSSFCPSGCERRCPGRSQGWCFVNSMADLFHQRVPFDFIFEAFSVMQEAASKRGHVFQVLTKRPGRVVGWWEAYREHFPEGWPPNVWIGTSVESQKYTPRITVLARLPAPVRFVSAEPLLEPLKLTEWLDSSALQWVIVGGESGAGARPMDRGLGAGSARSIDECWRGVLSPAAWGRSEQARRGCGHH